MRRPFLCSLPGCAAAAFLTRYRWKRVAGHACTARPRQAEPENPDAGEAKTETRTRTVYDSVNKTYDTETYTEDVPYEECYQETYYTWDQIDSWEKSAKKVDMMGREYSIDLFSLGMRDIDAKEIIPGETGKYVREEADVWIDLNFGDDEGDIRYGYEVLELPKSGTVFLDVSEGLLPVFGSKIDLQPSSPEQLVKNAQNDAETQKTIFRIFWGFLVLLELLGLGYFVWFYQDF